MIRRRRFELWVADMRRWLADPALEDRAEKLWHSTSDLRVFDAVLVRDAATMRTVIEIAQACRETSGPGRTVAEEELLRHLAYLAGQCVRRLEDAGLTRRPDPRVALALSPELEQTYEVVRLLCSFALETLRYVRSRDTFSGRRRAECFNMLRRIGYLLDLPEAVTLAEEAVARGGRGDAFAAREFLEHYFEVRNPGSDN